MDWRSSFIGLDTDYPTAHGTRARRVYLDSGATGLMLEPALRVVREFLPHYANIHTNAHFAAQLSTEAFTWAAQRVLAFVGAPADTYLAVFTGSGTTAAINKFAERMARARAGHDVVLASLMEHHSNDLPHRAHARVVHVPLTADGPRAGAVDLEQLARQLDDHAGRVRYVAATGASNVTGILNPLADIARLSHDAGVPVLVDGAQLTAHMPVQLQACAIDAYAFSGHKVYAPMSPGVLVARRDLLEQAMPSELGGGVVSRVSRSHFDLAHDAFEREHAGTPNIVGAVLLAAGLDFLARVGMDQVRRHGDELTRRAWRRLSGIAGLELYGAADLDLVPRAAAIAFNVHDLPHALTAAVLNDFFGVAVRNECFCAQPYVRSLLVQHLLDLDVAALDEDEELRLIDSRRGMVRATFGLYTTADDVERLGEALADLVARREWYRAQYEPTPDGRYQHRSFQPVLTTLFDLPGALERAWEGATRA
jgi:cysteine desulfurase / selenocysteine lyase